MMNTKKTSSLGLTKYALMLPLATVLLVTNHAEALAKKVEKMTSHNEESFSQNVSKQKLTEFLILVESTDDGVKLTGRKGCAFINISFSLRENSSQAVNQNGMYSSESDKVTKDENLADFLFTIKKTKDGFSLEGKEGTAWKNLSFSCPNGKCHQYIDQNGMAEVKMALTTVNKEEQTPATQQESTQKQNTSDEPFTVVEQMPQFPGGQEAMFKFLSTNIRYPVEALQKNINGIVVLKFIVSKTGELRDINVLRSVAPSLDNEAIRVVKAMPNWTPGKQNGENVNVKYTLPVRFSMKGDKSEQKSDGAIHVIGYGANKNTSSSLSEEPFTMVEQMPEFPGGKEAMFKFLSANIKYPVEAQQKGISGSVILRFIASKTGELRDIKVLRGVAPSMDNEAIRVVKAMPNWTPGKQKGENVDVEYTLPIRFSLK